MEVNPATEAPRPKWLQTENMTLYGGWQLTPEALLFYVSAAGCDDLRNVLPKLLLFLKQMSGLTSSGRCPSSKFLFTEHTLTTFHFQSNLGYLVD